MLHSAQNLWRHAVRMGIVAAALAGSAPLAHAITLNDTFNITIYQGNGSGNIGDPQEQANKLNPLLGGAAIGSGTYTGPLSFSQSVTDTIGAFLASGGGTLSSGLTTSAVSNATLSSAQFNLTTVFVITGTAASILAGTVSHDDGASLYDGPGYGTTVFDSSTPTVDISTAYSGLFGNWELIYVEANGLPAVLNFDVSRSEAPPAATPLPAGLPLFAGGAGLIGLLARRKKRRQAAA